MHYRTPVWITFALLLLVAAARGQLLGGALPSEDPVTVRDVISHVPLLPATTATLAVQLTINPRYHIQSAFAHEPYIAARLTFKTLPPGIQAGPIQAQKGTEIPSPPTLGPGTLSVYENQAYFLVPLTLSADAPPGDAVIELSLLTQACTDTTCDMPKTISLQVPIKIGKPGDTQNQPNAPLFAAARTKDFAPQPLPPTAAATPPSTSPPLDATVPGKQILLLSSADQLAAIAQRPYQPFNASENHYPLPAIFLFALLGGLILNVMPCVLPVIPLKALSFIQQAHGTPPSPRRALLHGLTFSAGIVTLFVALAVVLRVFGLFYGQQFQSPAFLITMVMFVVALALSMLGVWTIQPPRAVYSVDDTFSRRGGFLGSFSSGLMATLLATPCSAPFLGPVLAWALVQPAWLTAVTLATVGIGMALPYLILALFPQALSKIPRAGRWSELLKQALGIIMLGVAIYLVTLVPSTRLWPWVLAGTIVTALVCWAWGQIPTPLMSPSRIWTIRTIAVILGLALGTGLYWIAATTRPATTMTQSGTAFLPDKTANADIWLPFNLALLDQALQDGRPVLVDWTADWCINCRVLEATVLSREDLHLAIITQNALLLRADLSQDNPPAAALNQKLGSQSIPVLAIFAPSRPNEPVVLRDSYAQAQVIHELDRTR